MFWIGPEIIRRISGNASPVLDSRGITQANAQDGLAVFMWEVDVRPIAEGEFFAAVRELTKTFFDYHAGYQIKEVISQQPFGRMLEGSMQVGGRLWDAERGMYAQHVEAGALLDPPGRPFVLGLTRELAREQPGTWLSSLFDYAPPQLNFTRAEQRLLVAALCGGTDEEIASKLGVSVSAVKKGWQSVYAKVGLRMPDLLPDDSCDLPLGAGRGTEKKRRVLATSRIYSSSHLADHWQHSF